MARKKAAASSPTPPPQSPGRAAPTTVEGYIASLPDDRREAIEAVRAVILKNLDKGYEEGMQYGMIGYYVPHRVYPAGYHCNPDQPLPFAGLASQKGYMSLYLMGIYGSPEEAERFRAEWEASGTKLDMGKSCVRFKRLDGLPLEVIGRAIKRMPARVFVERYEAALKGTKTGAPKRGAKKAAGAASKAASEPTMKTTAGPGKKAAKRRGRA